MLYPESIVFLVPTVEKDNIGGQTTIYDEVPAFGRLVSSDEFIKAFAVSDTVDTEVAKLVMRVPYIMGLSRDWLVRFEGVDYDIVHYQSNQNRRVFTLYLEEVKK